MYKHTCINNISYINAIYKKYFLALVDTVADSKEMMKQRVNKKTEIKHLCLVYTNLPQ